MVQMYTRKFSEWVGDLHANSSVKYIRKCASKVDADKTFKICLPQKNRKISNEYLNLFPAALAHTLKKFRSDRI